MSADVFVCVCLFVCKLSSVNYVDIRGSLTSTIMKIIIIYSLILYEIKFQKQIAN